MNSERSPAALESKESIAPKREWSPGMHMCIQTHMCTHVEGPDILFVHKIKRSQKCDMVVKKTNTILDFMDRWWPNSQMPCDVEKVTKSWESERPDSTTTYIC